MSGPHSVGATLYRASWSRTGLRVETARVLLASPDQCVVQCADSSTESINRNSQDDWAPTREAALDLLLCRLSVSLRHAQNDILRLRAKIQSTQNLRANLESLAAVEA